ncbi:hypothetical protein MRB53_038146 [Persea americana]|nr:hypothetical protein MRB53_038146 [Persea americana]
MLRSSRLGTAQCSPSKGPPLRQSSFAHQATLEAASSQMCRYPPRLRHGQPLVPRSQNTDTGPVCPWRDHRTPHSMYVRWTLLAITLKDIKIRIEYG